MNYLKFRHAPDYLIQMAKFRVNYAVTINYAFINISYQMKLGCGVKEESSKLVDMLSQ